MDEMLDSQDSRPATRADLQLLAGRFNSLESRFHSLESRFDTETKAIRADTRETIHIVANGVAELTGVIGRLESNLTGRIQELAESVEAVRRQTAANDELLGRHSRALQGHENRLGVLESKD